MKSSAGDFIRLRNRHWLVEDAGAPPFNAMRLTCVDDDAAGDALTVVADAEIGASEVGGEAWGRVCARGTDDPAAFRAYMRSIIWKTSTAADRKLFQAPFRAGIRLSAYQILPLKKALQLPRVNLLIADDVGLGKTVEAGLVVRELLLRGRIDFVLVAAPPSMSVQWQEELESKFGLSFTIIDREHVAKMRRLHGFGVNPWMTGSRFIISHRLLTDEGYIAGLRDDILGPFRPRALLILDEAHHAAPSSGQKYAIDSQFTKAVDTLALRFEHRLFLSATPHNGHSNSFSRLMEMLDPQRFISGSTTADWRNSPSRLGSERGVAAVARARIRFREAKVARPSAAGRGGRRPWRSLCTSLSSWHVRSHHPKVPAEPAWPEDCFTGRAAAHATALQRSAWPRAMGHSPAPQDRGTHSRPTVVGTDPALVQGR